MVAIALEVDLRGQCQSRFCLYLCFGVFIVGFDPPPYSSDNVKYGVDL